MRKLDYTVNLVHLKSIKQDIVPVIFTVHQFQLIEKKFTNKYMTQSEKNEFSRTVSRKMKAINKIFERETGNIFVYGQEKMIAERLRLATLYVKQFSRKFKNKHVFITGSFLYAEKYNDIDIFVVTYYDKEDYRYKKFHINYITEDAYNSLFFASVKELCVSNKHIISYNVDENITIDTFTSLYQELFNDIEREFVGIKKTLREYLLQAAYIAGMPIPDSYALWRLISSILHAKNKKEIIKKIFVHAVIIGISSKIAIPLMRQMINLYTSLIKEYSQHKNYYVDLIGAFKEVIDIES